ncbi:MAG: hypothetical protein A3H51_01140 [Candidatus Spechtbacteria bacterium RIFCSPLOWO2_02_FULL_38_8]|uniref:FAD/NAD(P)-binding domain-containing protein n=1 Tax=Candidatus Spechtbacteria bacterium RIFCSPLOWO2_02_FULL_38_8 TaxID=1802164 RepID=A0A1G2HIP4_9BACT|nr:MAG: hypothetical protein A3H51_01140 [Candidatus Spechtbacteria bacterium RIFCSPLOWO2_02_FULL_38_8]
MYDLVIIGGGPAGAAAGVYAARKKVRSVLITEEWGGQSTVSPDIQNWIGEVSLRGIDMADKLKKHLEAVRGDILEIVEPDSVVEVSKEHDVFKVVTYGGKIFQAKAILVASGSRRKKLNVEGAERLDNKGVMYCASCDAPLFDGQKVVVVGGGNSGFEAAEQLLDYASEVYLFQKNDKFVADSIAVERVLKNPKMTAWTNTQIKEIRGEKFVESVTYIKEGEEKKMEVGGVFVEIGSLPNSDIVKGLVDLNEYNEIKIDCKNQMTSCEGIWAAGDVTEGRFKQNNISMGDGVKALEDIYIWLSKKK